MMQNRTHTCNELRMEHVGQAVRLVGWMENVREVGGSLVFVVLRDFYGTTQLVTEDPAPPRPPPRLGFGWTAWIWEHRWSTAPGQPLSARLRSAAEPTWSRFPLRGSHVTGSSREEAEVACVGGAGGCGGGNWGRERKGCEIPGELAARWRWRCWVGTPTTMSAKPNWTYSEVRQVRQPWIRPGLHRVKLVREGRLVFHSRCLPVFFC